MSKTLYIGNLPREATADTLRELFTAEGREVASVKLATYSKNGKSRGFGFVEMADDEQAAAALVAHQGTVLEGREMKIGEAKDKKIERAVSSGYEDEGGPRGGGGNRRGR